MFVLEILKADVFDERYTTRAAEYCPPTSISCIDKKDEDKEESRRDGES